MANPTDPETGDEVEFNCPICSSTKVLVALDERGYYDVRFCHECGYRKIAQKI